MLRADIGRDGNRPGMGLGNRTAPQQRGAEPRRERVAGPDRVGHLDLRRMEERDAPVVEDVASPGAAGQDDLLQGVLPRNRWMVRLESGLRCASDPKQMQRVLAASCCSPAVKGMWSQATSVRMS